MVRRENYTLYLLLYIQKYVNILYYMRINYCCIINLLYSIVYRVIRHYLITVFFLMFLILFKDQNEYKTNLIFNDNFWIAANLSTLYFCHLKLLNCSLSTRCIFHTNLYTYTVWRMPNYSLHTLIVTHIEFRSYNRIVISIIINKY